MMTRRTCLAGGIGSLLSGRAWAQAADETVTRRLYEGVDFVVAQWRPDSGVALDLWCAQPGGAPWRSLAAVAVEVKKQGRQLLFASNAGMFEPDLRPVGLAIVAGREVQPLRRGGGEGNFFLQPNGVFSLTGTTARIEETEAYQRAQRRPQLATQSGPLLVEAGRFHPAIREQSPNRQIRNGVGVSRAGQVWLVQSEAPVTFHHLARLFRDGLDCPQALYLDGVISSLAVPAWGRLDGRERLGPMLTLSREAI